METDAGSAIGVDVGGTKILGAVVDRDGRVVCRERVPTPHDGDERLIAVCDLVASLRAGQRDRCLPIGVGIAGLVDLAGVVRYCPNLDWRDAPVRAALSERLDTPVLVENDAAVAAWGEYRVGAALDATGGALMLTLGTGVGGGLVAGGRLVRGARGFAAEFGHMVLDDEGPRCPCGNRGCLEALCSGTAIGRAAAQMVADGHVAADSPLRAMSDRDGEMVTAAALDGDPTARAVLASAGRWLGIGIASLVNSLDPEVIVLGGGAMHAGDLLIHPATIAYRERVVARRHRVVPPIVRAGLGDDAGVIGAALLAGDERE